MVGEGANGTGESTPDRDKVYKGSIFVTWYDVTFPYDRRGFLIHERGGTYHPGLTSGSCVQITEIGSGAKAPVPDSSTGISSGLTRPAF
jgi:hypothetical protein